MGLLYFASEGTEAWRGKGPAPMGLYPLERGLEAGLAAEAPLCPPGSRWKGSDFLFSQRLSPLPP